MKTKIIKSKAFETKDGVKHTHFSVAYRGRVFGINTLRWEDDMDNLVVDSNSVTIKCEVEVVKDSTVDPLTGEVRTYLALLPKLDIKEAGI